MRTTEEELAHFEPTRGLMSELDANLRSLFNLCQSRLRSQTFYSEGFIGWNATCMELGHLVARVHEMQEDMEMIAQFWERQV